MPKLKEKIGSESTLQREVVTAEALTAFALSVGAVQAGEHVTSTASIPTFFTCFRRGEFDVMAALGVELKEILHGEQEYDLHGVIHAGETVTFRSRLTQVMEKKGKDALLAFMVFETPVLRESGELIATSRTTVIYRSKLPSAEGEAT